MRQPIAVTEDGHKRTVLISTEGYVHHKRNDREVLGLDDVTSAEIEALEASRPPEAAAVFDHEL